MRQLRPALIGVTGGIGSGKSVVCRVCALKGIPVYDCDSRAKALMRTSDAVRTSLLDLIGEEVFLPDGSLDTVRLGSRLFSDMSLRLAVEGVVHEAVRQDISSWIETLDSPVAMIESAVLHTSRLDQLVDTVWLVQAPESLRVDRVMRRSPLTEAQVRARMECQQQEFDSLPGSKTRMVVNDGLSPLLPQINRLLAQMIEKSK